MSSRCDVYISKYIELYLLNEKDILTLPYKKTLMNVQPNLCRHSDHVQPQTNICLKCFYKHVPMPDFSAASLTVVRK